MHSAPPHWPNSKFRDVPRSARGPLSTGYFRLRLGSLGGAGQRALTGNYVYIRRRITLDPQITLISEEFQPSLRGAMPGPISVLQFRERRHSREMSVATRPSTFGEGGSRHSLIANCRNLEAAHGPRRTPPSNSRRVQTLRSRAGAEDTGHPYLARASRQANSETCDSSRPRKPGFGAFCEVCWADEVLANLA